MKSPRQLLTVVGGAVLAMVVASAQQPPSPPAPPAQGAPAPAQGAAPAQQAGRGAAAPAPGPPSQFADPNNLPPLLRNYRNVTRQRLLRPEDENWLMIRRTYDGWGYSPLTQITPANVSRLKRVWMTETGEGGPHQAAPLVNNGVMYVSTPNNHLVAFDARTGAVLWRYKRPRPEGAFVLHQSNRGAALYGDKVFFTGGEAVLIAVDARTGREV